MNTVTSRRASGAADGPTGTVDLPPGGAPTPGGTVEVQADRSTGGGTVGYTDATPIDLSGAGATCIYVPGYEILGELGYSGAEIAELCGEPGA